MLAYISDNLSRVAIEAKFLGDYRRNADVHIAIDPYVYDLVNAFLVR